MAISKIDSGTTMVPRFQKMTQKPDCEKVQTPETHDLPSGEDTTSLSRQAQEGQKAATHTGMAGNLGAKETRKKDELERNLTEDKEALTKKDGEQTGNHSESNVEGKNAAGKNVDYSPLASLYGAIPNEPGKSGAQAGADIPPGNPPNTPPGNPPSAADIAAKQKAVQDDMQQAQTIYMQMAAERQKWLMKMWEIIQDTQTKIMEIMEGSALKKSKTMDTAAAKWAACLGGYEYK